MKLSTFSLRIAVVLGMVSGIPAQTVVNGGRVMKGSWDASGASHTLPARRGTAAQLPASCTIGEEYFATDAAAGQNKYYCTAPNTWTQQQGMGAFVQAGAGATNRTVTNKLQDVVHVKDFGATGDGATDDAAAFAAALASGAGEVRADAGTYVVNSPITLAKGQKIYFGVGTHTLAGIRFTDSTTDQTGTGKIQCAGSGQSTLKLKNGANQDMISQVNFATLTGQNSKYGLFRGEIQGCTLDGNRANQTAASYGIRLYGHGLVLKDVTVRNAYSDGIYTEWGLDSTFATPFDDLEGYFSDIRSHFNNGNGWTFRGPHDSDFSNMVLYQNGGWGLRVETSASYNGNGHLSNVNVFLNTLGGIYSNSSLDGSQVAATTASGWGMLIDTGAGSHKLSAAQFGGPTGLEVKAPSQIISGNIVNTTTAGLRLNGGSGNFSLQMFNNTGYQIDFASETGPSVIFANSANAVPGTMFNGTPSQLDFIFFDFGGSAANRYISFPVQTVHVGGWSPQFPQSNAVMAVINDMAQTGNLHATNLSLSSSAQVGSVTFAGLGTPSDGNIIYCSDCAQSNPCASGGTGAVAQRIHGAWSCTGSPGGTGNLTGPGSSTDGYLPLWSGTTGTSLATGLAVATTAGASVVPKAGSGGKLDIGWLPTGSTASTVAIGNDARLSDARTPTAHAASHASGGSDALSIAWSQITSGVPASYNAGQLQSRALSNAAPTDGQALLWNTSGNTWQPGTVSSAATVPSVFGRTGAITATTGDYTAAQVTHALDSTASYNDPTWITGLTWGKLSGVPATFTPTAHAASHMTGGDVITGFTTLNIGAAGLSTYKNAGATGHNFFAGEGAGNATMGSGASYNNAHGYLVLGSLTSGAYNNGFGGKALRDLTSGSNNNAFGHMALQGVTTGSYNNAFGGNTLTLNTTGYNNQAFGNGALYQNTTGYNNAAFGIDSLGLNSTGYRNSGYGVDSCAWNVTGYENSCMGMDSLWSLTTGHWNAGSGFNSMFGVTSGIYNTGVGAYADYLYPNTMAGVTLTATSGTANLSVGWYWYKVSYLLNAPGQGIAESALSNNSYLGVLTDASHKEVTIAGLPTYSGPLTCTGRKIYRTPVCVTGTCTSVTSNAQARRWYLVATIADNATTGYVDSKADGSLGAEDSGLPSASIALGAYATAYKSNQAVMGSDTAPIYELWLGNGVYSATAPAGVQVSSSGGSGTNAAGESIIIAGGPGTGTALGGSILFKTAAGGSSGGIWNNLTERWRIVPDTGTWLSLTASVDAAGYKVSGTVGATSAGCSAFTGGICTTGGWPTFNQSTTGNAATASAMVAGGTSLGATGGLIYNNAGSGNTQLTLQDSSSQAGAGAATLLIQDSTGTNYGLWGASTGFAWGDGSNYKGNFYGNTLVGSTDFAIQWKDNVNAFAGSLTLGLTHPAGTHIFKITDGSTGYGLVDAGGFKASGTQIIDASGNAALTSVATTGDATIGGAVNASGPVSAGVGSTAQSAYHFTDTGQAHDTVLAAPSAGINTTIFMPGTPLVSGVPLTVNAVTINSVPGFQLQSMDGSVPKPLYVAFPTSDVLCAKGGDTSVGGITCNNSSDATSITPFATTYTFPANYFSQYKIVKVDMDIAEWGPGVTSNLTITAKLGSTVVYTSSSAGLTGGHTSRVFQGNFAITAQDPPGATANVVTSAFFAAPNWALKDSQNTISQPMAVATNADKALTVSLTWAANGLASITYVSGATVTGAAGTTCLLDTFNSNLTGATATATLVTPNTLAGATFVVTNTGYGGSAGPTTANVHNGTATCSGTGINVTGSTLGGAQRNIFRLMRMSITGTN